MKSSPPVRRRFLSARRKWTSISNNEAHKTQSSRWTNEPVWPAGIRNASDRQINQWTRIYCACVCVCIQRLWNASLPFTFKSNNMAASFVFDRSKLLATKRAHQRKLIALMCGKLFGIVSWRAGYLGRFPWVMVDITHLFRVAALRSATTQRIKMSDVPRVVQFNLQDMTS